MSTSLKQQLQRLAAPQTAALVDHRRRASILFDAKEAAKKDRRTIYELGIQGLQELTALNTDFRQFEATLFDEATLNLERAIEQSDVNELLNRNIKKFLQHLSPYFLLRPAHLCIEWLLRRFQVHTYNRSDLLALALPYHETNIFVRVIQTFNLARSDADWEWLRPLQKPGLTLPKSTIVNRAASHAGFFAFVCRNTLAVLREFGPRAHLLQTHINFYTTVVVGALENTNEFKEWQISTVLESLLYALSGKVIDVASAGYIIAAQLVVRTQLKSKLCNALLDRVIAVSFEQLRPAAVMLLILIFDLQESAPKRFSKKALNLILGQKWLITVIAALAKQNIEVYPLCAALLRDAASAIESGDDDAEMFKRLAEQLLNEVDLPQSSAARIINCCLDCYVAEPAPEPTPELKDGDVIDLESDEDDPMGANAAFKTWYSNYLRKLEQKYPGAFDATIKEALSSKVEETDSRKVALKLALGYRLKMSNPNAADIYESLYHHNAKIRHIAMQSLLSNLNNYQTRAQNLQLLKACLADRLVDDSPAVITELLKLPTKDFTDILGEEQYAAGLLKILHKIQANGSHWWKLAPLVVKHITSKELLAHYDANLVLLALMPLLFPSDDNTTHEAAILEILKSKLTDKFLFLNQMKVDASQPASPSDTRKRFLNIIADERYAKTLPKPMQLFESIAPQAETYFKQAGEVSNFMILLTVCLKDELTAQQTLRILDDMERYCKPFQIKYFETLQKAQWEQVISLQLFTDFLLALARHTRFEQLNQWRDEESLRCFLRFFDLIGEHAFTAQKTAETGIWANTLVQLFDVVFPKTQTKIDFLVNFYMDTTACTDSTRLMAFKVLNSVLRSKKQSFKLNTIHLLKIGNALNSLQDAMRCVTLETFDTIAANCENLAENLKFFVQSILKYTPEISMDKEQYALMLFMILKSPKKRVDQENAAVILREILQLLNTANLKEDVAFTAQLLATLKHFNDEEALNALIPLALKSLDYATAEVNGAPSMLPAPYNLIYQSIVKRFQAQIIKNVIMDNPQAWKLLELIFSKFNVYMAVDERELQPLPCVLLETLDEHIYEELPTKYRVELLKLILRAEASAQNDTISLAAHKLLKNCIVDCKPLVAVLQQMFSSATDVEIPKKSKQLKRTSVVAGRSHVQTNSLAWKEGVALLELLEHKKKLENAEQLIPVLFDLLKHCLELEEQAGIEYTKQLILSTLLHCCRHASATNIDLQKAFPKATFRIDQIVQCVRATQNPQTHQNALTLLAHCAQHFPQQVLHNIVDIFTFMGSSVVRHDDAFSFHIIDNIIQSIIPIVVQAENTTRAHHLVIPVLKVFADIMLDVPEHRRLSLYTKLLNTLGVEDYLWRFLCIVFEAQVIEEEKLRQLAKQNTKSAAGATPAADAAHKDKLSKRLAIVMELTNTFAPQVVLETGSKLVSYLKSLPLNSASLADDGKSETAKPVKRKRSTKSISEDTEVALFDVQHHTDKQLRHYKYIIMQFLASVTNTPEFLRNIALLNDDELLNLKPYFQNCIINVLAYVAMVNTAIESVTESIQVKFWKVMLHNLHDVLDNIISLLSPDMFLVVVIGLMKHQLPSIRKKVIELLITRLQQQEDNATFFATCDEQRIRELIKPLSDIVEGIFVQQQGDTIASSSNNELIYIQQTALIAIKLLSKRFALQYIEEFKAMLANLTKIIKHRKNISKVVMATVVLTLVEILSNLKAHALEQLPKFMPQLIELLQQQAEWVRQQPPDHVCNAIITGTQKLFESLPRFLGPYIVDIITALSSISTRIAMQHREKEQRSAAALQKITAIRTKIATEVYVRILVPSCEKSYKRLMEIKSYDDITELMKLLRESLTNASNQDLVPVQTELNNFFLTALEFRVEMKGKKRFDLERITNIETTIIDAFVAYVLKLSESAFRPLYEKVYDWALQRRAVPETQLTYFLLNARIGEALKSLFVLFAGKFLDDTAALLNACNTLKCTFDADVEAIHVELLRSILSTLHIVFLHASKKFINLQRFELLLPAIVDQLENRFVLENENVQAALVACIAQLAVVVSSDVMWKQLNYQVLLKTRTNVPEVRILSFNCCVEIARKLGDEFTTLLPETVPFIAELFEDENARVEKNTRKSVQELESILGESLQNYL